MMDLLGYAILASIFVVLAGCLFTALIWAAFSDGQEERSFRTRMSRRTPLT